jgi:hypothetical protein
MLDTTTNEYCSRLTQIIGPAMYSCLLISPHIHSGAHDAPSSRLLMERVMPFENVNVWACWCCCGGEEDGSVCEISGSCNVCLIASSSPMMSDGYCDSSKFLCPDLSWCAPVTVNQSCNQTVRNLCRTRKAQNKGWKPNPHITHLQSGSVGG